MGRFRRIIGLPRLAVSSLANQATRWECGKECGIIKKRRKNIKEYQSDERPVIRTPAPPLLLRIFLNGC